MTLNEYKAANNLTLTALANRLSRPVSTVHGWLSGARRPDWSALESITRATGGAVAANDFASGEMASHPPRTYQRARNDNLPRAEQTPSLAPVAASLGLDPHRIAEVALAKAVGDEKARRWTEENRDAIAAHNAWVEKHGLPLARFRTF